MFANTQMIGVQPGWPETCTFQLKSIQALVQQGLARHTISPEQGAILREMHRVLETMHAHMVNQDSVIRAQQTMLMEPTRRG